VLVERLRGKPPDEARIAGGLAQAETCLRALQDTMGDDPFLAGPDLSLADLHLAPVIAYFRCAAEGAALLQRHAGIARWWTAIDARPSMAATRCPAEQAA